MNTYNFGHVAFMWGFYLLGCGFVIWLIVAGVIAAWQAIKRSPDGHEDRRGWHQDGGAS